MLGQPEIVLGVFAPVASVALAERVGRGRAEDLCLRGTVDGRRRGAGIGLVDEVADDPAAAALAWTRAKHLLPKLGVASLRLASRAVRLASRQPLPGRELEEVERLYLEELMATADAVEGMPRLPRKRQPAWRTHEMAPSSRPLLETSARGALYRDYSLHWQSSGVEGATGGLAIGYMPIYIPRELLHAQGVLPVGIMGGGDDLEIIRGDAYYQSYICHIPRSTIELGLNGSLDCLDGMIFPAICDVIRNLSGMWKMQFPDKLSRYLDVPQNFDPEVGGRSTAGSWKSCSAS